MKCSFKWRGHKNKRKGFYIYLNYFYKNKLNSPKERKIDLFHNFYSRSTIFNYQLLISSPKHSSFQNNRNMLPHFCIIFQSIYCSNESSTYVGIVNFFRFFFHLEKNFWLTTLIWLYWKPVIWLVRWAIQSGYGIMGTFMVPGF